MRFSEQVGARPTRSLIQSSELDDATRVALWNSFYSTVTGIDSAGLQYDGSRPGYALLRELWANELERPVDEFSYDAAVTEVKGLYLRGMWWWPLDNVQWMLGAVERHWPRQAARYRQAVETDLQRFLVGYRLAGGELIPVSNESEMLAIRDAMSSVGSNARVHLDRATSLLSNREDPQYAKVVHESINAVESVVAELTGQTVLSTGLKDLESRGVPTHKALLGAWEKLYGYTSDAGGIRHGLVRDEEVDEPLAVYFLVSCSAFINLLLKVAASA